MRQLSMTMSRAGGGEAAREAAEKAGAGRLINWTDLRSRVLLRMQTARGMDQVLNFHQLRNRTVAYDVRENAPLPSSIKGNSP